MKNIQVIIAFILLINMFNFSVGLENIDDKSDKNNTIYVDDNNIKGPWYGTLEYPYKSINDGLNLSINGDTVFVFEGIYKENILINKSIILVGESFYSTIIDGCYNSRIIEFIEDNILLKNFSVVNSGGYEYNSAIYINSNNNIINNCQIYRVKTGIFINGSNNNIIDNCSIHHNGAGILIKNSNNNTIQGCYFCHNSIGIHILNSNKNKIIYSFMRINGISNLIENSKNSQLYYCNISKNQVNLGGLFIKDSINISIENCIVNHNGAGFHIYSSDSIFISNCDILYNTHYGLIFRSPSKNIFISRCNIENNKRYAFYSEKNNICEIKNCNIYNNFLYGLYSKFSYINAKENFWGSPLGPSINNLRKSDKIGTIFNIIKIIPWKIHPIKNIGANWKNNKPYMEKKITQFNRTITIPGIDYDNDNVPDSWEIKWGYNPLEWNDHEKLDPDKDGLNNIEECYVDQYNSNPFIKDIFLEIDWMQSPDNNISNVPPEKEIIKIIDIFKNNSINLHIIYGEEIPYCDIHFSFSRLKDLYWTYFLNNDLNNPRKDIFHYGIICNYCPDLNFPFIGWDNLDTFAISAEWLKETIPHINRDKLIAGAIVHHLGHSLNLNVDTFNGIDNFEVTKYFTTQWFKYKNYKSCMNYLWKYKIYSYSDGLNGRGDFNDWENLNLSFFKDSIF